MQASSLSAAAPGDGGGSNGASSGVLPAPQAAAPPSADDMSDTASDGGPPPPALSQTLSGVVLRDDNTHQIEDGHRSSRGEQEESAGIGTGRNTPPPPPSLLRAEAYPQARHDSKDSCTPRSESNNDDEEDTTIPLYDVADHQDPDPHRHRLFLSTFLAAVETCRRETLAEMGYFVLTPSPAIGEVVVTRGGEPLTTTRQRHEVQLVDDRYVALIQAFLDLHAVSSVSCDRWLIGILAATTRHNLTQDCFIPVKSWWVDRLAAMHQRPVALLPSRTAASGKTPTSPRSLLAAARGNSAAISASVATATRSSRRIDADASSRGVSRGSRLGASPSATTPFSSEPTPTECNDYLFCKWLTLASITVEER